MFSSNDIDNVSPIELESQTSQRSFPSSWSNCPTPQAVLQSYHSPTPEIKPDPETAQYSQTESAAGSHSLENIRPGRTTAISYFMCQLLIVIGKLDFKCDRCNKTFERNSNLKYHRTTHEHFRQSLVCDKIGCLKTFKRRADMSRHIRTVFHSKTFGWTMLIALRPMRNSKRILARDVTKILDAMILGTSQPRTSPRCYPGTNLIIGT